jgi:hypothetical protein
MRLGGLEDEGLGRDRIEPRLAEHLKSDPVQLRLPLPLQGETASPLLSAHQQLRGFASRLVGRMICDAAYSGNG